MRVLLIHPNYHSGGAEIAGNWPPAWVAYLTGYLKAGGYTDVVFVDAMTHHLDDETGARAHRRAEARHRRLHRHHAGHLQGREAAADRQGGEPAIVTVLGGIHGTFMYPQVLKEAPWIDAVVRGEGEQVFLNFVRAVDDGSWARDRAPCAASPSTATTAPWWPPPAEPPIQDLDRIKPDWGILEWDKYIYIPLGVRVAIPNFARGCPFTCSFCSQWKFWRDYRIRDPKGGRRDRGPGEEPRRRLLHPGRRGAHHPPQEVHRLLRGADRARPAFRCSGASTPA
jgi:anaerobic magnesium-protoporphyrin IX monomethyl ester cyclase